MTNKKKIISAITGLSVLLHFTTLYAGGMSVMPPLSGFTDLMRAASEGNIQEVKRLVAGRVDVNKSGSNKATALMAATSHYNIFVFLLKSGSNPHVVTDDGLNVMTMAGCGSSKIMKLLIQRKVNPHLSYSDGMFRRGPSIVEAIQCNKVENVRLLIEKGLQPEQNLDSAIRNAKSYQNEEIIDILRKFEEKIRLLPLLELGQLARQVYENPNMVIEELSANQIAELKKLTKRELKVIRNSIFARYNYAFKTEWLRQIYQKKLQNYKPINEKVELTDIDKKNISFLLLKEKAAKY